MYRMRNKQAGLLDHVMRKRNLGHLVTTGKIEGEKSRGQQRLKVLDGPATWLGESTTELLRFGEMEGHDRLCLQQEHNLLQ